MDTAAGQIYVFGGFQLDTVDRSLLHDGEPVLMAPKLVDTLIVLVESRGEIVDKNDLMEQLWPDTHVEESNLTQNIFMLRRILGEKKGAKFIETVPRRGYRFAGEVRTVPTRSSKLAVREETHTRVVVTSSTSGISTSVVVAIGGSVLAAILLTVGAGFLWVKLSRPTREGVSASAVPRASTALKRLTYQSSVDHAAISPDGKYLAYDLMIDTPSGPKQSLKLQNISTGSIVEVMPPAMPGYASITFSPDGNYLYFGSERNAARPSVTRIPIFGGTPQYIAHNVWSAFTLSPDGQQVAFLRSYPTQSPSEVLVVAQVKDGAETEVFGNVSKGEKWMNMHQSAPAFSPDGKRIVVTSGLKDQIGVRGALFEVTIAGGAVNEIPTPRWASIEQAVWLHDGRGLVVAAQEKDADPLQLWYLSYPSGEAHRLTNDFSDYGRMTVTADGKSIAAQQTTRVSNIWLWVEGDRNAARPLTSGTVSDGHRGLDFSPKGLVTFVSNRNGAYDIWTIKQDGTDARQITYAGGWLSGPAHSPDGRYIVFHSNRSGVSHIWRVDADGNHPVQLTTATASAPAVSPDGQWVYYTNWSHSPTVIDKVPIEGGQPIRVTDGRYSAGSPSVSPDGNLLAHMYYHEAKGWHIAVMPANGGDPIKLFDHGAQHIYRWTPDSRALIYIKPVSGNLPSSNLWLQSINGGAPVQLTNFTSKDDPISNFAVSADGKQILIARGRITSDAVLLSNLP